MKNNPPIFIPPLELEMPTYIDPKKLPRWSHPWDYPAWCEAVNARLGGSAPEAVLQAAYQDELDPVSLAVKFIALRWHTRWGIRHPIGRPRTKPPAEPKVPGKIGRPFALLDVADVDRKLAEALCRACGALLGRRLTPEARRKVLEVLAQASRVAGHEGG